MDLSIHKTASATIRNSFFSRLDMNDKQGDIQNVWENMVLGEKYFRLKNYERAYDWFLSAKVYSKSQKCLSKINVFLIFCLLALDKVQEALKILDRQQSSLIKYERLSLFQVYVKLGLTDRGFHFHMQFYSLPNYKPSDFMNVQALITLIHGINQKGKSLLANRIYQSACNILVDITSYNPSILYEIFQQAYFLLKYGFKTNQLEYRRQLLFAIDNILKKLMESNEQAYNFTKNQLDSGQQYDILLLYFDPPCQ